MPSALYCLSTMCAPGEGLPQPVRRQLVAQGMSVVADANTAMSRLWWCRHPVQAPNLPGLIRVCGAHALDCNRVKPSPLPRICVADMESTLIAMEYLDLIAARFHLGEAMSTITAQAMAGELQFAGSLRQRLALLRGISWQQLTTLRDQIPVAWSAGCRAAVQRLGEMGVRLYLATGGLEVFAAPIAATLGAEAWIANRVVVDEHDTLTGELHPPLVDPARKQQFLQQSAHGACTMAMGDGANDIPMLQAAHISVGWRCKPVVAPQVDYQLHHSDMAVVPRLLAEGARLASAT